LQEGFARVGDDQQLADKNRSMAAIKRNALWPQVAASGLIVDRRSSTLS
jgi:hypothetical protein